MDYIWAVFSLFSHGLGSWTQLSSRLSCLSFSFSLLHLLWLPRLSQAPPLIFLCLQGPPRKPSVNHVQCIDLWMSILTKPNIYTCVCMYVYVYTYIYELMKRCMHAYITRHRNYFQRKLYKSVNLLQNAHSQKNTGKLLYFYIWERNWCLRYKIIYT